MRLCAGWDARSACAAVAAASTHGESASRLATAVEAPEAARGPSSAARRGRKPHLNALARRRLCSLRRVLRLCRRRHGVERAHPRGQALAGRCARGAREGGERDRMRACSPGDIAACSRTPSGAVPLRWLPGMQGSNRNRQCGASRTLRLALLALALRPPLVLQPLERGAYDAQRLAGPCMGRGRRCRLGAAAPFDSKRRRPTARCARGDARSRGRGRHPPVGLSNSPICRRSRVS
jgi:hypothetical protein